MNNLIMEYNGGFNEFMTIFGCFVEKLDNESEQDALEMLEENPWFIQWMAGHFFKFPPDNKLYQIEIAHLINIFKKSLYAKHGEIIELIWNNNPLLNLIYLQEKSFFPCMHTLDNQIRNVIYFIKQHPESCSELFIQYPLLSIWFDNPGMPLQQKFTPPQHFYYIFEKMTAFYLSQPQNTAADHDILTKLANTPLFSNWIEGKTINFGNAIENTSFTSNIAVTHSECMKNTNRQRLINESNSYNFFSHFPLPVPAEAPILYIDPTNDTPDGTFDIK